MIITAAIMIPPSDLPAYALPDYEPTEADLLAIESSDENEISIRLASANTLSAFEARRLDLVRLRADLPLSALLPEMDETTQERVA